MFKNLDPLLHSQLRLSIVSILITVDEADFNYLKEQTGSTSGNLSIQINKLKDASYIKVVKKFKGNYPITKCRITPKGVEAFEQYVKSLNTYINVRK